MTAAKERKEEQLVRLTRVEKQLEDMTKAKISQEEQLAHMTTEKVTVEKLLASSENAAGSESTASTAANASPELLDAALLSDSR